MRNSINIKFQIEKIGNAIDCLIKNNFVESALILTYAGIDQMAWLAVADREASSKDFKSWVERYLNPQKNLGCTSEDLWAARCGLIHTATAESRDYFNTKAKRIYYCSGEFVCTENTSTDTVVMNSTNFICIFIAGCVDFINYLESNDIALSIAANKADTVLAFMPTLYKDIYTSKRDFASTLT